METLAPDRRRRLRDHRLHWQLRRCWDASPWYRACLEQAGLHPSSFRGLPDLGRIPVLTDAELRAAASLPVAALAVAPERWWAGVVTGGAGLPRVLSETDRIHQADMAARALWAAGARPGALLTWEGPRPKCGLGDAIDAGADRVGIRQDGHAGSRQSGGGTAIVGGVGAGGDDGELATISRRPGPGTPLAVRVERWPPWGAPRSADAALSVPGVGATLAHGCPARAGLHWADDHFLVEVVDPATGAALSAGQEGAVLVTDLTREGTPLLRYRTALVGALIDDPCACGRTSARSPAIRRSERAGAAG